MANAGRQADERRANSIPQALESVGRSRRKGLASVSPPRTGSVEPGRRVKGGLRFVARIRLRDGSRQRVTVPAAYSTPAGGRTARERAELYAEARQEREDETGELFEAKKKRQVEEARQQDPNQGETCTRYFGRFVEHRTAIGKVRRARDLESCWKIDRPEDWRQARRKHHPR